MLKLKDIILGLNLDEGLIKTYPSDKTCDILNREKNFSKFFKAFKKDEYSIRIFLSKRNILNKELKEDLFFVDYIGEKPSDFIEKLLFKMNSMGYYPNFYSFFDMGKMSSPSRFNLKTLSDLINNKTTDSASFNIYFSAKYSDVLTENIPKFVYHLSKVKYRKRIKDFGLVPKGSERYDDRVYVVLDRENFTDKFLKNMKDFSGEKILDLYQIDTEGLNIKLYKDPEFKDYGYYIKANIPPKNIVLIDTL